MNFGLFLQLIFLKPSLFLINHLSWLFWWLHHKWSIVFLKGALNELSRYFSLLLLLSFGDWLLIMALCRLFQAANFDFNSLFESDDNDKDQSNSHKWINNNLYLLFQFGRLLLSLARCCGCALLLLLVQNILFILLWQFELHQTTQLI